MEFSPSIKLPRNTTADISLQTDGTHNLKFTNKDFLKNLKTILSWTCQQDVQNDQVCHVQSGSLQADYVFGRGTFSGKFAFANLCALSTSKTTLGLVFNQDKYFFGAEGNIKTKDGEVAFDSAVLNFQTAYDLRNTVSGAVNYNNGSGAVGITGRFSHKHPKFNFAAQGTINTSDVSNFDGKLGFEKHFRGGAVGKLTVSTSPEVSLSFSKEVCDGVNFTVATSVPWDSFEHRTGFNLSFDL